MRPCNISYSDTDKGALRTDKLWLKIKKLTFFLLAENYPAAQVTNLGFNMTSVKIMAAGLAVSDSKYHVMCGFR